MKKKQSAGLCIFCGSAGLSKEHFWPQWVHEFLPKYPDNKRIEVLYTHEQDKLVRPPEEKERPGHTWNKSIRVVCDSCNNGWMSALEEKAKPVLLRLMRGENHTLSLENAHTLSTWIVLKAIVAEHSQKEEVVSTSIEREMFRLNFAIPRNFKIWIAKCGLDDWRASYLRHAATITKPNPDVMPLGKNIHSIAFGIGDLFVFLMHTAVDDVLEHISFVSSRAIIPLYPINKEIFWPPEIDLTSRQALDVAKTLNIILQGPNVIWKPSVT